MFPRRSNVTRSNRPTMKNVLASSLKMLCEQNGDNITEVCSNLEQRSYFLNFCKKRIQRRCRYYKIQCLIATGGQIENVIHQIKFSTRNDSKIIKKMWKWSNYTSIFVLGDKKQRSNFSLNIHTTRKVINFFFKSPLYKRWNLSQFSL